MSIKRTIAISAAALAAGGLLATPASAASLPRLAAAPSVYDSHADDAFGYRYRGWRRHDRIDGGDILAGILVLGAVAAIADSASNNSRDRDRYRDRPVQYREPSRRSGNWGQGGIDSAVDMCVSQVERGRTRVDSVDNATRDANGWRVSGATSDGEGFTCRLDNDGRIRSVDIGDNYAAYEADTSLDPAQGQLSDDTYLRARTALRDSGAIANAARSAPAANSAAGVDADIGNGPQPAYPGGPLPGDEGYEDSLGG
jgi:hypothetical protein